MGTNQRKPKGYLGRGHETIGSDILAVFGVVGMPKQTLGESLHSRLVGVKPDGWYPIELLLELMETLEEKVGNNGLRQMGRKLFIASHQVHVKKMAKSAADVLYAFDDLYGRANRGTEIGGWAVLSFGKGKAQLEKTTPHHCVMEEGLTAEALNCLGIPATVTQERCFRQGADSCLFTISSFVTDERWGAAR
jgi:hypothetical protein